MRSVFHVKNMKICIADSLILLCFPFLGKYDIIQVLRSMYVHLSLEKLKTSSLLILDNIFISRIRIIKVKFIEDKTDKMHQLKANKKLKMFKQNPNNKINNAPSRSAILSLKKIPSSSSSPLLPSIEISTSPI